MKFLLLLCTFMALHANAGCVVTKVSDGSQTWSRLSCGGGASGMTAFAAYIEKHQTLGTATGRTGDGNGRFSDLSRAQKCDTVKANKPAGCDSRPAIKAPGCTAPVSGYGAADFTDGCKTHDACYDTLGANKSECDKNLYGYASRQCDAHYPTNNSGVKFTPPTTAIHRHVCFEVANTFYGFVTSYGTGFFDAAQKDAACNKYLDLFDQFCK